MPHVLIVEDEPDLRALVAHHVEMAGHSCSEAGTCAEALAAAGQQRPDIVILDLMLPDGSGVDVCRSLRAQPKLATVPILMLTALAAEPERVTGFEAGADDYVTKPFSVRELMLRISAILRRAPAEPPPPSNVVEAAGIRLDAERHEVHVQGELLHLTALEFRLLAALLANAGKVLTRQSLLEDVWEMSPDLRTRTVDTHVKRLRERLGPAGEAIATVRGVGYSLRTGSEGPQ